MVSGGMTCVKYLLFCFNLLFAISGLAILVVGILIPLRDYQQYKNFFTHSVLLVTVAFIAIGAIIFCISFLGCCGAVKENHCMIMTFSAVVLIILVLEIAAGVYGFMHPDKVENKMLNNKYINESMKEYYTISPNPSTPNVMRHTWDILQHEMECCGMNGPSDWKQFTHNDSFPHTCCPDSKDDGSCTIRSPEYYKDGCMQKLMDIVIKNKELIGAIGLGVAAFQLFGAIFACILARNIRKEYEVV